MENKDILYQIYCSNTGVDVFDLLYETGLDYEELKPLLAQWTEQDILRTEDGKHYEFVGDEGMFSEEYKKEHFGRHVDDLFQTLKDQLSDREDDTETSDRLSDITNMRHAYLEARRQQILRMMAEQAEEDDEEDEDEDDGEIEVEKVDDDEDPLQEDDVLSRYISDGAKEGFSIFRFLDSIQIEVKGVELCGTDVKFNLFSHEGDVYFGDQGATLIRLHGAVDTDDDKVCDQIKRIAAESGVEIIDEELCVKAAATDRMFACLFRLYAAMMRIYHIKDLYPAAAEEEVPEDYIETLEHIVKNQEASIGDVFDQFGFAPHKIGAIFRWMEQEGFITPYNEATKERRVLLSLDEFKRRFGKK